MNIFQNMFRSKVHPNSEVAKAFNEKFPNSISVEWSHRDDDFEAVFYFENIECIALYDKSGKLILLKRNLSLDTLPSLVAQQAQQEGELMNAVVVESEDSVVYEIIVRDEALLRYVVYIDENGYVTGKKIL